MTITDKQRQDLLDALDVFGVLMIRYKHVWTVGERQTYERAVHILGGKLHGEGKAVPE